MKQVVIDSYGAPWDVARCAEVADVGAPAADEAYRLRNVHRGAGLYAAIPRWASLTQRNR